MSDAKHALDPWLQRITASQPYPLLFATLSGAHLYGFPSPDSDYDLRGAHVLPVEGVAGLDVKDETIQDSQIIDDLEMDIVSHDVRKFFRLLLKKNGYVLEQLYSPLVVQTSPEHAEIKALAAGCITRHHAHHYLGFAATQWKLFLKESPRRIKPLLYVYRVLLTGIHLMRTGRVEANLLELNGTFALSHVSDLVTRKLAGPEQSLLGQDDIVFHEAEYQRLRAELEAAQAASKLPELPDDRTRTGLNELLVRIRLKSAQGLASQGRADKEQGLADEPEPSGEYRLRTLDEILAPYSDPETWRWQIDELRNPELKALFSKRLESLGDAAKQSAEEPIRLMLGPMSFEESLAASEEDEMLIKGRPRPSITKIISGGQTGADRAALDWAIENGIEHGGYCPRGRIAEDVIIPARYRLTETEGTDYSERTKRNVAESDATVIITLASELRGGSRETAVDAMEAGKKYIHLSRANKFDVAAALRAFVRTYAVGVLNIAGSREREEPGIYGLTRAILDSAFPRQQ
jgi:uncharacterized protein